MTEISFAEPQWVYLLWAVLAFLAVLAWLDRRSGDALERLVSTALWPRLLSGPSVTQRAARLVFLGLAGCFLTLALMRPQWGLEVTESRRAGAEIMICLDVSRSMLAEDVAPNRLERAKAEIRDLLGLLDGDQVGLIAFAGRASVLSPLTPDFGFLGLALNDASPGSVARGGTRLEEPIRKAIAGFGDTGDVSRSILLITDGEDHDSFPLEAARDAAQRGIRILAIGFGAEGGSEIPITDLNTGARTLLRDADGAVVRSHLDGALLREMALATSGAYIPAGTGQLDLESIYRRHIAPLTRGRSETNARTVRNDAFQWAVLLGLVALLGAVVSTARGGTAPPEGGPPAAAALLVVGLVLMLSVPATVIAQQPATQTPSTEETGVTQNQSVALQSSADAATDATDAEAVPDPRATYNEGLNKLEAGDAAAATRLLELARSKSGTDSEVRFRATYSLGWAEVSKSDSLLESNQVDALEALRRAAGWFREAVDLRPGNAEARYNFEVAMRRALELADAMAVGDEQDLEKQLDSLIDAQREFLGSLRAGLAVQQADGETSAAPQLRREFRSLAARELTVLTDSEQLSERMVREAQAVQAKPAEEQSPKEALHAARLESAVGHLHHARERLAQTRTRLRRMQGERAYRRAAAALGTLQRARDQFLDPVAKLNALLADGLEVARQTALKSALEQGIQSTHTAASAPEWLTPEYLTEAQAQVEIRTRELHDGLATGLAAAGKSPTAETEQPAPAARDEQEKLLKILREATPLVDVAQQAFESASAALGAAQFNEALIAQRTALEALATAREQFLELRGLVELVYGDQRRVAALIAPEDTDGSTDGRPGGVPLGAALHERNLERAVRLNQMLADAMVEAQASQSQAADGAETPVDPLASGKGDQLERGYELLRGAMDAMHSASGAFAKLDPRVFRSDTPGASSGADSSADSGTESGTALTQARLAVDVSVKQLEELRRLFFSVLEHLRETAHRQQLLADDTEKLAALADPNNAQASAPQAAPLGDRQQTLAGISQELAAALRNQAAAPPPTLAADEKPAASVDTEKLNEAADLVAEAGTAMNQAATSLNGAPPSLGQARTVQDKALGALIRAIAVLQDGQDQDQNQDQDQDQSGEQQQSPQDEQQPADEQNPDRADLAQLLQGVRDREAQRREARAKTGSQQGYETVEKDW